ncbi:TrbG/VirB9 family P-type conjugative transfer protein (plasmid) [Thalassospira sp. SM2505]
MIANSRVMLSITIVALCVACMSVARAQTEDEQIRANLNNDAQILTDADITGETADLSGVMLDMKSIQEAWQQPDCLDALGKPRKDYGACALGQGQSRPGFVAYHWEAGAQMKIYMRPRFLTVIRWPEGVELLDPLVGDNVNFEATKDAELGNIIWVKSRSYNIDTDLKVRDSAGHIYSFILLSMPEDNPKLTATEVAIFPQKSLIEQMQATKAVHERNVESNPSAATEAKAPAKDVNPLTSAVDVEDRKTRADYLRNLNYNFSESLCDRDAFDIKVPDEISAQELAPEHVCTDGKFTIFDYGDRSDTIKRAPTFQVIDDVDVNIPNYKWTGKNSQLLIVEVTGDFSMIVGEMYVCFFTKNRKPVPSMVTIGGV